MQLDLNVGLRFLVSLKSPVFPRTVPGEFLKIFAEEEAIGMANLRGNLLDPVIGADESSFCLIDALPSQPVDGAWAERLLECVREMRRTHSGRFGQPIYGEPLEVE